MKSFIIVALLVAAAVAAPAGPDADAQILRFENDNIGLEGHKYSYETSNGISEQSEGQLVDAGTDNERYTVRGQYSYTGPDGVFYQVIYLADENGFQAKGAHIPA